MYASAVAGAGSLGKPPKSRGPPKADSGGGSSRAGAGAAAPPPSQRWDLTTVGQAEIARAAFGDNLLSDLAKNGIDPRGIYEPSTPDTQCNNVIGVVDAGTHCWICGLLIQYKRILDERHGEALARFVEKVNIEEKEKGRKGKKATYTPETIASIVIEPGQCEHRLPIIQAIMLMAVFIVFIYKALLATVGAAAAAASYLAELSREYAWSHQHCNMIKNDDVYIYQAEDGTFHVDRAKIMILLRKIWTKKDLDYKYSGIFLQYLRGEYDGVDSFIYARVEAMAADLEDICAKLNKSGTQEGGVFAPGLLVLSAAVSARHGPMHKEAAAAVSGRAGGSAAPATVPRPDLGSPDALVAALLRKFKRICSGPHDSYINESFGEMRDKAVAFYAAAIALSDMGDTKVAATRKIKVVNNHLAMMIINNAEEIFAKKVAFGLVRGKTGAKIEENFITLVGAFLDPIFSTETDAGLIARYQGYASSSLDPENPSEGGGAAAAAGGGAAAAGGGAAAAAPQSDQPTFIAEITQKMLSDEVQLGASELQALANSDDYTRPEDLASLSTNYVTSKGVRELNVSAAAASTPLHAPRRGNGNVGFGSSAATPLPAQRGVVAAATALKILSKFARRDPYIYNAGDSDPGDPDPTEEHEWVDARYGEEGEADGWDDSPITFMPRSPTEGGSEGFGGRGGARRGRGRSLNRNRKTKVLRRKKRSTRRKNRRL
jgi:hypothetical protein